MYSKGKKYDLVHYNMIITYIDCVRFTHSRRFIGLVSNTSLRLSFYNSVVLINAYEF